MIHKFKPFHLGHCDIIDIFSQICGNFGEERPAMGSMAVVLIDDEVDPKVGEYVAEIHFVLRRVDESTTEEDVPE